jgi:predicted transcriptional regulator
MRENPKKKEALTTLRTNEHKWTKPLMASGWLAIPNIIVEKQNAIGLTPLDMNIILHLAMYWWTADNKPRPSKKTIAEAIGVTPRTVQRRIAAMERDGLVRREQQRIAKQGSKPNLYHFDGLIDAAKPYAIKKLQVKKQRQKEDEQMRRTKRRPKLHLVRDGEID